MQNFLGRETISRSDAEMSGSKFNNQFNRVKRKVDELTELDDKLPFANKAVKAIKRYMDTLIGKEEICVLKDSYSIQVSIVRVRLTDIESLVDEIQKARKEKNEKELIQKYEKIRQTLIRGSLRRSNLKNLLDESLSGKIKRTQMQDSIFSGEFLRIDKRVQDLMKLDPAPVFRQGLDDVQFYINTLKGERRKFMMNIIPMDKCSMRTEILIARLGTIYRIIDLIHDSIQNGKTESEFLRSYEEIKKEIQNGYYWASNLRDIMAATLSSGLFKPVKVNPPNDESAAETHPIHAAIKKGKDDMIKDLLELGCNIDSLDSRGKSPVQLAADMGKVKIVKFLLEKKAKGDSVELLKQAKQNAQASQQDAAPSFDEKYSVSKNYSTPSFLQG